MKRASFCLRCGHAVENMARQGDVANLMLSRHYALQSRWFWRKLALLFMTLCAAGAVALVLHYAT